MRVSKRKWKSDKFRPVILDSSGELRKRYHNVKNQSEMTTLAFNRKMIEAGLAKMEQSSEEA